MSIPATTDTKPVPPAIEKIKVKVDRREAVRMAINAKIVASPHY